MIENPIEIVRGDDVLIVLTYGVDVSTWTFAAQVRATPDATTVAATFTFDMAAAATGQVSAALDAASTAALDPSTLYYYDIQKTVAGKKTTVQRGRLRVLPDTTRP